MGAAVTRVRMNDGSRYRCRFCGRHVKIARAPQADGTMMLEVEHELPVCALFDQLMRGVGATDVIEPDGQPS